MNTKTAPLPPANAFKLTEIGRESTDDGTEWVAYTDGTYIDLVTFEEWTEPTTETDYSRWCAGTSTPSPSALVASSTRRATAVSKLSVASSGTTLLSAWPSSRPISRAVMTLAGRDDVVAVHAVCQESVFWETLERLKAAGASAVLVLPIEKMM